MSMVSWHAAQALPGWSYTRVASTQVARDESRLEGAPMQRGARVEGSPSFSTVEWKVSLQDCLLP